MQDVICPQCRESYHETTDTWTAETTAEPHMVRLKDKYQEQAWSTFSPHDYGYGCMECPGCGAAYAPNGYLMLGPPPEPNREDDPTKTTGKVTARRRSSNSIKARTDEGLWI